jgi:hypothetical protein
MPNGRHVLVRRILRAKLLSTSLAFEDRRPVICVVHVLIASTLGTEGAVAGLAFGPVVIFIPVVIFVHMVLAVMPVAEGGHAGLALVHLEE